MSLSSLRTYCSNLHIPLISFETEIFLKKLISKYHPKTFVEIGTAVGYSGIVCSQLLEGRKGIVYTFEISYPSYIQALDHIKRYNQKANIIPYLLDFSQTPLTHLFPNMIDMVFIDAQKSQYLNYLLKIKEFMSDNGIIILDDILKYQNKTASLYEYLSKNQINYQIFGMEQGDGVMVIHISDFLSH